MLVKPASRPAIADTVRILLAGLAHVGLTRASTSRTAPAESYIAPVSVPPGMFSKYIAALNAPALPNSPKSPLKGLVLSCLRLSNVGPSSVIN